MNNTLTMAYDTLLKPAGLTDSLLQKILGEILLGRAVDAADLYFQAACSESWVLEDSIIKQASYNIARGVGVRAMSGEKTGFAYSDDIQPNTLEQAATAAKSIAQRGQHGQLKIRHEVAAPTLYPAINPLPSMTEQEKIALLQAIDNEARQQDPRVTQVSASISGSSETILLINSEGNWAADVRPLVRINVTVIVEDKGRREQGFMGGGCRGDYLFFVTNNKHLEYAREAVRQALLSLDAEEAPAGNMPVVLGPGWPGVLLHEAVGHGLEGDFNRKGSSAFTGRIGEQVAAKGCTIVDDGTLPGRRGSLNIDDEGTPSQCTVLIENGILHNYMQDNLNARLMNSQSTGNGRRESYATLPMPRMTNTYMLPGQYTHEEIIASVSKGLYAANFAGGQVDITSGKFVFSTSEAYLIENGKITRPVKGATLIGDGPSVLQRVSMLGNNLELDSGIGICGKEGQSIPVGVGQPTVKIDQMTVGGTQ